MDKPLIALLLAAIVLLHPAWPHVSGAAVPWPPTPNLKLWVISFTAKVIKWAWKFILTLLNAQRALWHSPQHTDERVHWHPTTGWPSYCNMNWHWSLFHDPWQWLSSSQAKNCSRNQQSQESKQEPSCRTWTWALSTGSLGWVYLPRCTFRCSHNPEFTLMDCKLVGCGYSVISSQFPDSTNWLSSHLSDQCQGSFDGPKSLISTIPWGLCPLKTQSSQEMGKRDRNRDNCVIKYYLLCFLCTLASRLCLYSSLGLLFMLSLTRHFVWIVFCCFYSLCWLA